MSVIRKSDPIKNHGRNKISILMLKLCDNTICKTLHMFYVMFGKWDFSSAWKMANLVPIHKKENKQLVKNYRISLPPICGKIFEKSIQNEMYCCLLID